VNITELDYLDALVTRALQSAAAQREFISYLQERIVERLARGRSMDSDEYRSLLRLTGSAS
jgi:hypothetical protein